MFDAFADFFVGEGIAVNDVFADGAIGQAIRIVVDNVEDDGSFAVLHGVNVIARRAVKTIPAAVVSANEAGRVNRSGDTFAAGLNRELIVHQKIGLIWIADLMQAAGIQLRLNGTRDAIADDVIFPVRIALVGGSVAVSRRAIGVVARDCRSSGGRRRSGGAPSPSHAFVDGDGRVAIDDDVVVASS